MAKVEKNCSINGINLEAVCTGHNLKLGKEGTIDCVCALPENSGENQREKITLNVKSVKQSPVKKMYFLFTLYSNYFNIVHMINSLEL